MFASPDLLVFSDLDGTLLSHDTYKWKSAQPALSRLSEVNAGVVLASSKTAAEMILLRQDMGLSGWPAIIENGAGILPPKVDIPPQADDYDKLRAALGQITPSLRAQYVGFGDMSADDVVKTTGLSRQNATLAKTRSFSEPGLWSGTDADQQAFIAELTKHGITAREGGRFLTLSFGQTKADRMLEVIATYRPKHTLALGDAPNDVEMLETADCGVVIANPHRAPLPALKNEHTNKVIRTTLPGPDGWNVAVLEVIKTLRLT